MMELGENFPALLIIDVFSSQLLHLTVNGSAKAYMERSFTVWYSTSISLQLDDGRAEVTYS